MNIKVTKHGKEQPELFTSNTVKNREGVYRHQDASIDVYAVTILTSEGDLKSAVVRGNVIGSFNPDSWAGPWVESGPITVTFSN